jgi:hypothetical protein
MSLRLSFNSSICYGGMVYILTLLCAFFAALDCSPALAQGAANSSTLSDPAQDGQHVADIEHRLNEVTAALSQTQQALQQSLLEVQQLRAEVDALKLKRAVAPINSDAEAATASASTESVSQSDEIKALREQQDTLQAEIAQHEQTKVETSSKYSLRVNGLVLFNAFSNVGVADDADLPTIALTRYPGSSHGSLGASMRQTLIGFEATGPHLGGARSSAMLNVDFFGGVSTNEYGYSTPTGLLRLRQAAASLDWNRTTAQVGMTEALITPLSPTSYATVAMPSLSASGNLWTWSPQIRVEQRIPLSDRNMLTFEAGLIDPGSPSTSVQLDTPVEASRRPGYEGRIAFHADSISTAIPHPFAIGVGAYSSNQYYGNSSNIHSWAVTGDWQIPLFKRVDISGEAYRGRALGGFGGGVYKDVVTGIDTVTGLSRIRGVDAVGGWAQAKFRFTPVIEANAVWGMDDALSSNFDGLILSNETYPLELNTRNSTVMGNFIIRPKTYLIFSPEYRRLQSWVYDGPVNDANIFTLTAGFQF